HFERGSFGENGFWTTGEEDAHESRGGSGGGADACAHSGGSADTTRKRADTCSGGCGLGDGSGVAGFVAFAPDCAFFAIEFFTGAAVNSADARAEIARGSIGECQGIEAQMKFPAAFHFAGTLDVGDGAGNVAAWRNHDFSVDEDGENRFEIHAVAGDGVF